MPAVAILSDIHGNAHALDAVLADVAAHGITEWWCLGDVVGYGAFPRETLATCLAGAGRLLAGNHDLGAAGRVPIGDFSDDAADALRWTADELGPDGVAALGRLMPMDTGDDVALYHASPRDPVWEYILTPRQAEQALVTSGAPLTFVGHTHMPAVWQLTGTDGLRPWPVDAGPVSLDRGRWLVNPGSVGQPRDHDARASWAIHDPEAATVQVVRTPYDVEAAQHAIRRAGLPPGLADRLALGR